MPDSGLFYIGSARAQREFVAFARGLSLPAIGREPRLRSIAPDIAELEAKLLAAYRPPAAIERHGEFITASAALKEAKELDDAGLRQGALVRYLQAALRIAPLLPPPPPIDRAALTQKLAEFETRLSSKTGEDHSIGRIFLESAQTDLAASTPPQSGAESNAPPAKATNADLIAADVLPRYFAALGPARPLPSPPASAVTVTLVRWPYT